MTYVYLFLKTSMQVFGYVKSKHTRHSCKCMIILNLNIHVIHALVNYITSDIF